MIIAKRVGIGVAIGLAFPFMWLVWSVIQIVIDSPLGPNHASWVFTMVCFIFARYVTLPWSLSYFLFFNFWPVLFVLNFGIAGLLWGLFSVWHESRR